MEYPICQKCGFPYTASLAGPLGLRCQCINPVLETKEPVTTETATQPEPPAVETIAESTPDKQPAPEVISTDQPGEDAPQEPELAPASTVQKLITKVKKATKK